LAGNRKRKKKKAYISSYSGGLALSLQPEESNAMATGARLTRKGLKSICVRHNYAQVEEDNTNIVISVSTTLRY
jgi:hypothetical protein